MAAAAEPPPAPLRWLPAEPGGHGSARVEAPGPTRTGSRKQFRAGEEEERFRCAQMIWSPHGRHPDGRLVERSTAFESVESSAAEGEDAAIRCDHPVTIPLGVHGDPFDRLDQR